ncbi:MAG: flagellar motor switch protein FliM [Chloroflexi bacterium HGW-Chloroflexi-10]|nr:MAG: flagellar motor switch protein FliM [Chloroflexi bacterium HGW-Chloroflexi-10]
MLSQSEIDALLAGAIEIEQNDGDANINLANLIDQAAEAVERTPHARRKIQAYNFWSPDRFSKEQMRAVELVHEDLTERLMTSLPTFLRTNVRPRLVHTEQGRFHDFLKDFAENTLFHMIMLAPLPGQTVMTFSPNISVMILEQRLGGRIEGASPERPLTDIDQALLRGMVEHMLTDIKESWGKVVVVEPALEDSTTNQHWVQMILGNEKVMLLTFEISLSNITGTMSLFIPFSMLKPIANVLNPHIWITGRKEPLKDPEMRKQAMRNLHNVRLPIRVVLGNAQISLNEVMDLQEGDVIRLDSTIRDHLVIQVADNDRFTGQVGRVNNHMAVQITGVIRDGEKIIG